MDLGAELEAVYKNAGFESSAFELAATLFHIDVKVKHPVTQTRTQNAGSV